MCAEFQIKTKYRQIQTELDISIKNISPNEEWDIRVKMSMLAPVLGVKDGEVRLNELVFPVNPFPNARLSQIESNKKKIDIAEAEEQIVRIYQVPMWKLSFEKFPCLVPMTSFFEPAYWGERKGDIIEFKDPKETILFVPAILIKPRVPSTGKLNGFAMLTHTASVQMLEYHHRLLMFLMPAAAIKYLSLGEVSAEDRYNFLLENRYVPKLKTSVERHMAKGWDKRIEHHQRSLVDEKMYLRALQNESVRG